MTFGISVPQNYEISSKKCNFEVQPKRILLQDTEIFILRGTMLFF